MGNLAACIKMNEIVNKFLLAGNKFMPDHLYMHLLETFALILN